MHIQRFTAQSFCLGQPPGGEQHGSVIAQRPHLPGVHSGLEQFLDVTIQLEVIAASLAQIAFALGRIGDPIRPGIALKQSEESL
jgi:hypothetical protein